MILYWSLILALSMLLYVLLDGFDLGVGMLFGLTRDETRRRHMLAAVSPLWDGNETWLIVAGVVLWGAFSAAYSLLVSAFYVPVILMLAGSPSSSVAGLAVRGRSGTSASWWVRSSPLSCRARWSARWPRGCRSSTAASPATS